MVINLSDVGLLTLCMSLTIILLKKTEMCCQIQINIVTLHPK